MRYWTVWRWPRRRRSSASSGASCRNICIKIMIYMSATNLPSLQAARDDVNGYVYERGFKVRFESTWLQK